MNTTDDFAFGDPLGSPFDPSNQLTACWIDFGIDGSTFYVSNAINASISRVELLGDGTLNLIEQIAAAGVSGFANGGTTGPEVFGTTDGFIDLDVTDDGKYLYQLEGLNGAISAYEINADNSLTLVQQALGFLPEIDTQGIVTFMPGSNAPTGGTGPAPTLLGDINLSTQVDFLDIAPFISLLSAGEFQEEGDCNEDGALDFLDISCFIALLANQQ